MSDSDNSLIPSEVLTPVLEKRESELINDIRGVGPDKPIGYLPLYTITEALGEDVASVITEAEARGIRTRIFGVNGQEALVDGALYAYDSGALQSLIDQNLDVVTEAGWPVTASEFVERVATEYAPDRTPLYDLIADAFGDKTGFLRTTDTDPNL